MSTNMLIVALAILALAGFGYYFLVQNPISVPNPNPVASSTIDLVKVNGVFNIATSSSQATWTGSKKIITNYFDTGTVGIKSGSVSLSQGEILAGKIVFDLDSIGATKTGLNKDETSLTTHLKSADFFDVKKYPEATFVVTKATRSTTSPSTYNLDGNLTLKGKTAPLSTSLSVTANADGSLFATGQAIVDRTIWDVRYGSEKFFPNLGDKVINDTFTLDFKLMAIPDEAAQKATSTTATSTATTTKKN